MSRDDVKVALLTWEAARAERRVHTCKHFHAKRAQDMPRPATVVLTVRPRRGAGGHVYRSPMASPCTEAREVEPHHAGHDPPHSAHVDHAGTCPGGERLGDSAQASQTEAHAPSATTQDGGLFTSHGDNVHISKSLPPTASGHGWWTIGPQAGVRPTHAVVTVQLQIKRTDGIWVNVGEPGSERVKPGGGSANRANARVVCADRKKRMWRSVVDVDIIGYADSPNQKITPELPVAYRIRSIP